MIISSTIINKNEKSVYVCVCVCVTQHFPLVASQYNGEPLHFFFIHTCSYSAR